MREKKLRVVYILPSRYDDEGYVFRWWRGVLPSNTLACMRAISLALVKSGDLGEDVKVTVDVYDDSVQPISVKKMIRKSRRRGERLLVGFTGVQTNQFSRASDLALAFRAEGAQVMIGGFHVSGTMAMFDKPDSEMQNLMDHGVSLVYGEAESPGLLRTLFLDALAENMKPSYRAVFTPDILHAPIPWPDKKTMKRFARPNMTTVDTSRGCPFNCSFCTVITVQGRKMRHRSPECILTAIEKYYAQGINLYFFTDDDLARSPVWEELFDGMARLRKRGIDIQFMMQVDTVACRIPNFIEKAAAAGCYLVFIGVESLNPENSIATGKRQNHVEQFADMVTAWHKEKILVHSGYIIGLPHDTPASVRRDLAVLKNQVKVDEASFFMLTPLPGSRDHKEMVEKGVPLDKDLNRYDSFHATFRHPNFAPGEWYSLYLEAWETFYTKDSMVNVLLRTPKERYWDMFWLFLWVRHSTLLGSHPMITGFFRFKDRKARRACFQRESIPVYLWRRMKDTARQTGIMVHLFFEFQELWLLTRKHDDSRRAVLADLRSKWAGVQVSLRESKAAARYGDAARELHAVLGAASERLRGLSVSAKTSSRRLCRQLNQKAKETEAALRAFELQAPTRQLVARAEHYVKKNLLTGYEDLVIRHVAQRRRLNAYRRDILRRFRSGRFLTMNVSALPRAALFECMLGLRFGWVFLSHL